MSTRRWSELAASPSNASGGERRRRPRCLLASPVLRGRGGQIVPLGEIATLELDFGKNALFRHNARRTITVRADALAGVSTVVLETSARESLAQAVLPEAVDIEFRGETEERDRSYGSLWSALKWGLLLIYVIMAVQFNSLLQPFIVPLTVLLAVVGVTLGLLVASGLILFVVLVLYSLVQSVARSMSGPSGSRPADARVSGRAAPASVRSAA